MEQSNVCETNLKKDVDAVKINELYEDCLNYLKSIKGHDATSDTNDGSGIMIKMENQNEPNGRCNVQDQVYEMFEERSESFVYEEPKSIYNVENEMSSEPAMDDNSIKDHSSERLRKLSAQLPKIIITQSDPNLDKELIYKNSEGKIYEEFKNVRKPERKLGKCCRSPYSEYPRRLVSKDGTENVAHISNIPYEKIRLLNDSFHTLINLRWRWIVIGTILVHFAIWFVFAVFWYITALAHYDFEPDPPKKACVTGGKDFVTIFLASVEAQTTIGFGDRTIDEECPESIFLFVMQLILGTGLSGVLTCVVYAKLTRPEKLSRDGVGFSKKAAISTRDGKLCLMFRAWDLNYDHIIGSEFSAHFVKTHRTKEGEVIRYYTRSLELQQREFLLWPVTLVHVIDEKSPLYKMTPEQFMSTR
ncbi:Inward rectifier potassium channel 2 [Eumeta japonica]|uniref:Inward rectifier potassium channel 2 n=1 Tax=Eumeta variegata TaxID=151549 RepID=A0A4C1SNK8_EUMVA|nr:Inward rectifier potassium channel 2 [Eumeta japonica]